VSRLTPAVSETDHRRGPDDAPVTLVEYGDYECPHSGRAHPIVMEAHRRLGTRLRFVFRNFPLSKAHPHAQRAAEAAEAAGGQGKFWEMHDMLFEHQDALADADLVQDAALLEIDVEQFRRELTAGMFTERVRKDFRSGVRSGVNGTPAFFINGVRYDGPLDLESLVAALEAAQG
jgi:protein-disulfide isomerase